MHCCPRHIKARQLMRYTLNVALSSGQYVDVAIEMAAPPLPGEYTAVWSCSDPMRFLFGDPLVFKFVVIDPAQQGTQRQTHQSPTADWFKSTHLSVIRESRTARAFTVCAYGAASPDPNEILAKARTLRECDVNSDSGSCGDGDMPSPLPQRVPERVLPPQLLLPRMPERPQMLRAAPPPPHELVPQRVAPQVPQHDSVPPLTPPRPLPQPSGNGDDDDAIVEHEHTTPRSVSPSARPTPQSKALQVRAPPPPPQSPGSGRPMPTPPRKDFCAPPAADKSC
eukprot:TRINITY_DN3829_c0_g1_i2.p2 TRINITY_DN3829_c0_g1~~TRINITY_DN3829_c0_g1_i2.p2  ORF type:complete len:281 (-),score=74.71 TRINITY_DN3829_c0_g1_i2:105-947(-)